MDWEEIKKRVEIAINNFETRTGIKEGAHVRYTGIKDNDGHLKYPQYCGNPSDPRGILHFDTIYEIECMMIARSFSLVKLVGFGEKRWSTSIFEVVREEVEKKCLKIGGYVRYIGAKHDKLNSESIFEVESIEKHAFGIGFDGIRLVGYGEIFARSLFEKLRNKEG